MSIKTIFLLLILATSAYAASWVQVDVRHTPNFIPEQGNFCATTNQCLICPSCNPANDNFPDRYWTGQTNNDKPKCIMSGQYLLDDYCDLGKWSSRTKLLAETMITIGLSQTPSDFALYCDKPQEVLNRYQYTTTYGQVAPLVTGSCPMSTTMSRPCINNVCVLHYGTNTIVGTSLNYPIDGADKSILKALNQPTSYCNSAKNFDNDYDLCGNNIWYNHDTQSIINAPVVTTIPQATTAAKNVLSSSYNQLNNYVFTEVHDVTSSLFNYELFNNTPNYKQVYVAKNGNKQFYTFKVGPLGAAQKEFAGWHITNIPLFSNICNNFFIPYGGNANCKQTTNEILTVSQYYQTGPSGLVQNWNQTTRLRVIP